MKIAALHHHSEYSIKKALTTVNEIVEVVVKNVDKHYPAISICDFSNAGSWAKLSKLCDKNKLKPIYSQEFNIEEPNNKNIIYHLTSIAKNDEGIKNLVWLHNNSWENFYYVPRIKKEWLKEHTKGIIWLTGDIKSELSNLLLMNEMDKARELLSYYKSIFEDLYIEIVINDYRTYTYVNKLLMDLARETNTAFVITNDGRYISKEQSEAYKVWLLSGEQYTMEQKNKLNDYTLDCNELYYYDYDDYLRIAKENSYFGAVFKNENEFNVGLENTVKIAEMCNASLDTSVKLPKTDKAKERLREKLEEGIKKRGLDESYRKQIEKEFDVITKIGAEDYFLILNDIAEYCDKNDILRGDRGSCAASVVCYCLGITSFDPTAHKLLLFDRFLSVDRVNPVWKDGKLYMSDPTDVDVDVSYNRRDELKNYIINKYGKDRCVDAGNMGSAKWRSCIQDISRVYGLPLSETLSITKMLPIDIEEKKLEEYTVDEVKSKLKFLEDYFNKYPQVESCVKVLLNRIRVMGHHASGVVIVDRDINSCLPVYIRDGVKLTLWIEGEDDRELANNGFFKFDILGSKNLTVLKDTIELINKRHNTEITVKNIPLEDKKSLELLRNGDTNFIFQLESGLAQSTCKKIEPNSFDDVVMISGLVRPGPIKANVPQQISDRKKGNIKYTIPEPLKNILGVTYGKCLYQESQLLIAQTVGGMSAKDANKLRKVLVKAKNKKVQAEEIPKYRKIWDQNALPNIRGYFNNELDAINYVEELWNEMESMAQYSFNAAHATSYTLLTMREAFLKSHYYPEFMSIALSYEPSDNINKYIMELKGRNIELRYPDINFSTKNFEIDKDGNFLYPLSHIKNITDDVADEIIKYRPYHNLEDLVNKIDKQKVNKTKVESLILAGCFDFLYKDLQYSKVDILNHYFVNIRKEKNFEQVTYKPSELNKMEEELLGVCLSKKTLYDYTKDMIRKMNIKVKFPVELSPKANDLSSMHFPLLLVGKVRKCERKKGKSGKEYDMISVTDDVNTLNIFKFGAPSNVEKGSIYLLSVNKFKDGNNLLIEYGKDSITKIS